MNGIRKERYSGFLTELLTSTLGGYIPAKYPTFEKLLDAIATDPEARNDILIQARATGAAMQQVEADRRSEVKLLTRKNEYLTGELKSKEDANIRHTARNAEQGEEIARLKAEVEAFKKFASTVGDREGGSPPAAADVVGGVATRDLKAEEIATVDLSIIENTDKYKTEFGAAGVAPGEDQYPTYNDDEGRDNE